MKRESILTNKILAYKEIPDFNMDESVDWAIDMISLGYDTPSLLILAGLSKPTNFFETENYLLETLKELSVELPVKEIALRNYYRYFITLIADSVDVKENLYQLYKIAGTQPENKAIFDFYLLYWAWDDFDSGNTYTHYWQDATAESIEKLTIAKAKEWLKENYILS